MRNRISLWMGVLWLGLTVGSAADSKDPRSNLATHDWPAFLGAEANGKSSETGLLETWAADGPPLQWHVDVGEGYSGPVVSHGKVFVFDRSGDEARLRALDSGSGKQLWQASYPTQYEDRYQFSNGPRAAPTVDEDRVYTFGAEGRLRCHQVADGKLLWEVDTASRFNVDQDFFGVGTAPVIFKNLLIAMVGGKPQPAAEGQPRKPTSGIVAFDKLTGEVRYQISDEQPSYTTPVVATIHGRPWGFAFARGGLVGFDPAQGTVDFHFPWRAKIHESVNAASPVVVDDTVFLTEAYGPGAVLLRVGRRSQQTDGTSGGQGTAEVVWKDAPRKESLQSHWASPIYHRGVLYGCHGRRSGEAELRAVEHQTGKVLWRHPGIGMSTLMYAEGKLIVLTERGKLLLVRATREKFELLSEAEVLVADKPLLEYPAWSPPILAQGALLVRGKHRLASFDLKRRKR